MKNQEFNVHAEMRDLIARSCVLSHPPQGHRLYNFQKELFRHFFKSVDVTIDHDAFTITLWSSEEPKMPVEDDLYKLNNAVALTISYSNLEETLKGCLEDNYEDISCYRGLLSKYGDRATTGHTAVSA